MSSNTTDSAVTATAAELSKRPPTAEERLKNAMSSVSKHLICPITQELMVDPVLAEDENTYERSAIKRWISTKSTSPLNPNCRLNASRLMTNRMAKKQIEELVESGELNDQLCAYYANRKALTWSLLISRARRNSAQMLYDEGKVEEAAELGLPVAQGLMADRCFLGRDGVTKDLDKSVEWAKKAAEGGDKTGQFRLGVAYHFAQGGLEKDCAMAKEWYYKAAEQGCSTSMNNIGNLYEYGGHGVTKNPVTAVSWYRDSAVAGLAKGQHNLGNCYYHGRGVTKNQETALNWFKKAAIKGEVDAICDLGSMMVKGEGGAKRISEGCQWLEKAAAKGHKNAQVILDKMSNYEVHTQMINDLNSAQSELAAANRQLKETVEGLKKAEVKKLIPEGGVGAMKAADLRQALEKLGIETKANGKNLPKKELVTALEAALKPSSDNSSAEGEEEKAEEEEAEAEEITLADGTTVYYVEETGLCYSAEAVELGSYNSDTNSLEESKEGEKKEKAPKAKRGKNAYMFFLEAQRGVIKAELEKSESYIGQTIPVTAITKAAGAKWKALSDEEKTPWNEKASLAKAEAEAAATARSSSLDLGWRGGEEDDRPVITLADGTTVYYVEDTGLCYSTNGGIQPLGSYNSDTNSLEELNLTP